jgi:hypothetical protein
MNCHKASTITNTSVEMNERSNGFAVHDETETHQHDSQMITSFKRIASLDDYLSDFL